MSATGKAPLTGRDVRREDRSRVETTGEAYGLQWAVVAQATGHRCGYVRVPDDSILSGRDYNDRADGKKIDPEARWDYDHPEQGEWVTLDSPAPDAAGGAGPSPVMVRWSWVTSVMQVPEHQAIEHLNSVMS